MRINTGATMNSSTDNEKLQRLDAALHDQEQKFRKFVQDLPMGVIVTQNGLIRFSNALLQEMIDYTAGELEGKPFLPFVHEEDRPRVRELHERRMRGLAVPTTYEMRLIRKDGQIRTWQIDTRTIDWDGPAAVGLVADITDRRREEQQARQTRDYLQMQIERMPIGIIVWDKDFRAQSWNPAAERIFGFTAEDAIGKHPYEMIVPASAKPVVDEIWCRLMQGDLTAFSVNENITKDGRTIICDWTNTPLKDEQGKPVGALAMVQDITERKLSQDKIHELAFFDQLTGLPNRTLLQDRLRQISAASQRSGHHSAVLLIDLDQFKTLNDTRGHDAGDMLLKQVAARLQECVRESDTVARLGGDEFVAVLCELGNDENEATRNAREVGNKILESLRQTYLIDGHAYFTTASIGITVVKGHHSSIDDLMKQADLAMYKSKAAGRNTLSFFDPAVEAFVLKRAALEAELRNAIDTQQFELHYQPQVSSKGVITGAEALVRWNHPHRGMVLPSEFIPLAEETGQIQPLGQWVLKAACEQLACWATRPEMAHLTLAVNLSPQQFHRDDFVEHVLSIIHQSGANPHCLKLEITESVMMQDIPGVVQKMLALKARGVGFSLDDFGTGYSSLSYLKELPLNELKIDRSFVRDVLTNSHDAAIAKTVITLAQSMGFAVIAEGVEASKQLEFLAKAGCHAYQGYVYSPAVTATEFEQMARPT